MDKDSLRTLLEHASGVEPEAGPVIARSLIAGRKLRRRRRLQGAAGSALAVAVVAAAVPLAHGALTREVRAPQASGAPAMAYVTTTADTVVPINLRTDKALAPIKLTAHGLLVDMVISRTGKTIYVASADGYVTPINAVTRTAGRPIRVTNYLYQIVLAPDGRYLYAVTQSCNLIRVNINTGAIGKTLRLRTVGRIVMAPDGRTAYGLSPSSTNTVWPIDLVTDRPLPSQTFPQLVGDFAVTPDGKSAWVFLSSSAKYSELVKVNLANWARSAPIRLPGTDEVAFGPGDATAYAFGADTITPVDLATGATGAPIKVQAPLAQSVDEFALSPNGHTAIVYNGASRSNLGVRITPVNLADGTAHSPVYLGFRGWWPIDPTFVLDRGTAYVSIVREVPGSAQMPGKLIPVQAANGKPAGPPISLPAGHALGALLTR
jgi:hypothetical protein